MYTEYEMVEGVLTRRPEPSKALLLFSHVSHRCRFDSKKTGGCFETGHLRDFGIRIGGSTWVSCIM